MPRQWQRKEANKIMNINDPNPPQLYPLSTLQKARSDAINEELGILKMPLFESLSYIKANHKYGHHIRIIRYDPFFVLVWSPDQVDLHNDIVKHLGNSFSSDSTGSVCISIKRPGLITKHIFLTIQIDHVGNKIAISWQMISELNDANMIAYWLQEFIKSGGRKPDRMITDRGKSLRNGICLAMNNLTFKQCNQMCLLILQSKVPNFLETQLSSDVSHLINLPRRLEVLEFYKDEVKSAKIVQTLHRYFVGN